MPTSNWELCLRLGHLDQPPAYVDATGAELECGRCGLRWHESRDGVTTVR
jgi:hypothetical protein